MGLSRGFSTDEGSHTDRNEYSRKIDAELGDVACRRVVREPPRILLIQSREVRRSTEQHADLNDVSQPCPRCFKDGLAVCKSLARLVLDAVARKLAADRIGANRPGDKNEWSRFDALAEKL